jgi:glycosyltransferase involved in cell wall biosynthesis
VPKVSVIIPTYNRQDMVGEAVQSVLNQTEHDLEVIVVDDGSIDNTRSVIESLNDHRVRYFYKTNGGPASARNFGLNKANGEFVAFLDHDDLWPADFLEVMVSQLEKRTDYGAAYSPIKLLRNNGSVIKSYKKPENKSGWITRDLFNKSFVWTSATIIRKSALENIWYDETLRQSYEDGDFFLRLSTRIQFLFVEEVEAIKMEHASNLSAKVGIQPTRILVLERFYFRLGGDKLVPAKIAMRKISHACRKVAEDKRREGYRTEAITLYKRAIEYWPVDLRLYIGFLKALFLKSINDPKPDWKMPPPLGDPLSGL